MAKVDLLALVTTLAVAVLAFTGAIDGPTALTFFAGAGGGAGWARARGRE